MLTVLLYSRVGKSSRERSNASPCKHLHECLISLLLAVSAGSIQLQILNKGKISNLLSASKGTWGNVGQRSRSHTWVNPHLQHNSTTKPDINHVFSYTKTQQSWVPSGFNKQTVTLTFLGKPLLQAPNTAVDTLWCKKLSTPLPQKEKYPPPNNNVIKTIPNSAPSGLLPAL